jgi:hypothetical protein
MNGVAGADGCRRLSAAVPLPVQQLDHPLVM